MTSPTDLTALTLSDISARIHAREVSCQEVARAQLDRIARLEPTVNGYVAVHEERALAQARAADALLAAGVDHGPLHGVPIAVKDLYAERGIPSSAGSSILADWEPDEDSTAVYKLRQAGAIIIGRANMDEFAFGGTTENTHYGVTHNPWDVERSSGGSSGGSGAIVAARMAYAALGTDTAASIRNPSHFNGVTGIKPSFGRVSRSGVVPLAWTLDHAGPLARSVEDAALVLSAISGHDTKDETSSRRPVPDYAANLAVDVGRLRAGIVRGYFWEPIVPEVADLNEQAYDVLRGLGMQLEDITLDQTDVLPALFATILPAEAAAYHHRWIREGRGGEYGYAILDRLIPGYAIPAMDYVNAQRARALWDESVRRALRTYDVLVMPTVPYTAAKIGQIMVQVGDGEEEASFLRTRNLFPFNLTGMPALSVPIGFDGAGLPAGMQIISNVWDEQTAFNVGHAYQQATDWHTRAPALG